MSVTTLFSRLKQRFALHFRWRFLPLAGAALASLTLSACVYDTGVSTSYTSYRAQPAYAGHGYRSAHYYEEPSYYDSDYGHSGYGYHDPYYDGGYAHTYPRVSGAVAVHSGYGRSYRRHRHHRHYKDYDDHGDGKVRIVDASRRHKGRDVPDGWHHPEWFKRRGYSLEHDRFEDRAGHRFGRDRAGKKKKSSRKRSQRSKKRRSH